MAKLGVTAEDLAGAQLALMLVQFLIDELVKQKVIEPAVVAEFPGHVERIHGGKARVGIGL